MRALVTLAIWANGVISRPKRDRCELAVIGQRRTFAIPEFGSLDEPVKQAQDRSSEFSLFREIRFGPWFKKPLKFGSSKNIKDN